LLDRIIDIVFYNKLVFVLRVIASLSGLVIRLFPNATNEVLWGTAIISAAAVLSFVAQIALKYRHHLTDRFVYRIVARKYGYGYEDLKVKAFLKKPADGGMRLHRRVNIKTTSVQDCVRHYLHALAQPSQGVVEIAGIHLIEPKWISTTAKKVPELSYKQGMVIEVTFKPPLAAGDTAVYEIREKFPPGSFATTAQEMADMNLLQEHFSWIVDKPTKHIQIEVFVPTSLAPIECGYDVWYSVYSEQRHRQEWDRMHAFFKTEENKDLDFTCMRLDIPFPVLGLVYVIRWQYAQKNASP
jgi:hypothetical protein